MYKMPPKRLVIIIPDDNHTGITVIYHLQSTTLTSYSSLTITTNYSVHTPLNE
jgi:hypothetical protein